MAEGVVLYVNISVLERMPSNFEPILASLRTCIENYESAKKYLLDSSMSPYFDASALEAYDKQLLASEEKIKQLKSVLSEVAAIYKQYDVRFDADDIGNLDQANLPWYKTNEFKLAVGIAIIATTVVLAVVALPGTTLALLATGAAMGAATGSILGGLTGGLSAKKAGGSFLDGFAEGFMWGSIGGAITGALGAGIKQATMATKVVASIAEGTVNAGINTSQTLYHGGDVQFKDVAISFFSGVAISFASSALTSKVVKIKSNVKDGSASETFDYYMDMVEELDVSTAPNTATFYSGQGNRALAGEFANVNGKTTLEMTTGGKYLDDLKLFEQGSPLTQEEAVNVWSRLSIRYAQNASGNTYGFVKGSWDGSIFNIIEYPALKGNPNVTNIFTNIMQ